MGPSKADDLDVAELGRALTDLWTSRDWLVALDDEEVPSVQSIVKNRS